MILLFGANGQLGRELSAAAARAGVPLTGFGRQDVDIAEGSAIEAAVERLGPHLLINAAAYTKVDAAEDEPAMAWRANATGPEVLATIAATTDLPLIHLSTDFVFDGTKAASYCENDAVAPLNVYGRSKAAGEAAVRRLAPRHLILRTAWLFGVHGRNFVKTILRLTSQKDELRVVADQFGSPTAAAELAEAIVAVAPRLQKAAAPYGTYHLVGSGTTSWYGFAQRIVGASGRGTKVIPVTTADYPTAARRPANSALDASRFTTSFGIRLGPWQEAVDRTVAQILSSEVTT